MKNTVITVLLMLAFVAAQAQTTRKPVPATPAKKTTAAAAKRVAEARAREAAALKAREDSARAVQEMARKIALELRREDSVRKVEIELAREALKKRAEDSIRLEKQKVARLATSSKTTRPKAPDLGGGIAVKRRNGWIKIGAGVAAMALGAYTYSRLHRDYGDYKNLIANPEGITSYAAPGIYVSGGLAVAGLGISLSSVANFKAMGRSR